MPLKKAELKKFQERLEELRGSLLSVMAGTVQDAQGTSEDSAYSQHQADQGTDDFNRSVSLQLSEQEQALLRQIDRALEKISEGNYGVCDISGEEIPRARLEAVPYATMTVKAQEKLEKGLL